MKETKIVEVHIGKLEVSKRKETLITTLGSCVGIALHFKEKNIVGLAHCMLPEGPLHPFTIGAKYVNQGIYSLLRMMRIKDEDRSKVIAEVAGGSNMLSKLEINTNSGVGIRNGEVACELLSELGIKLKAKDLGGKLARRMSINGTNGEVVVKTISDSVEEANVKL